MRLEHLRVADLRQRNRRLCVRISLHLPLGMLSCDRLRGCGMRQRRGVSRVLSLSRTPSPPWRCSTRSWPASMQAGVIRSVPCRCVRSEPLYRPNLYDRVHVLRVHEYADVSRCHSVGLCLSPHAHRAQVTQAQRGCSLASRWTADQQIPVSRENCTI